MRRNVGLSVLTGGALLIIAGCANYQLGSMLPPGIRSIHVPTFVNRSSEPQIEASITAATVREFQRDGTLEVEVREQADAVLDVVLTGYRLQAVRYDKDRAKTAAEYRVFLEAKIALKSRSGGVLLEKQLRGDTTFALTGDLASAKMTALPNAAQDLAHKIVESVVEYW